MTDEVNIDYFINRAITWLKEFDFYFALEVEKRLKTHHWVTQKITWEGNERFKAHCNKCDITIWFNIHKKYNPYTQRDIRLDVFPLTCKSI